MIRCAPVPPTPRQGSIKVRRLITATSDAYRAHLFGLLWIRATALENQDPAFVRGRAFS